MKTAKHKWRLTLNRNQLTHLREAINGKPGEKPVTVMDLIAQWADTQPNSVVASLNKKLELFPRSKTE